MSTRKRGILQRLTRSRGKTKDKGKVSVQPTEVAPTSLHDQNYIKELHDSPINHTFSNISDFPQSSTSSVSDSNDTMASDLMKCLNNLQIRAVSVTNSTHSVSAIPRLAPPPNQRSLSSGCDKLNATLPRLRSKFSQRSDSARVSMSESKEEDLQTTPSPLWVPFSPGKESEFHQNRSIEETDVKEREIMFKESSLESKLDEVFRKLGSPNLELVERVDVCFSGTEMCNYSISGEVLFKLSNSENRSSKLPTASIEFLENFDFLLTMKQLLQGGASLNNIMIKKSLRKTQENLNSETQERALDWTSPTMMNKANEGILESRNLLLSLDKCYQEALDNPITLLKYSAQPSALCGPPLSVQIHWMKSEESKFQGVVDVALVPNRKLGISLWGVQICLKGFENIKSKNHFQDNDSSTTPQAKWNPSEFSFEWCLPVIHPMDSARHLRVRLSEEIGVISERDLTASIKFVIPHTTLSGASLIGWIDPRPRNEFEVNVDEVQSHDSVENLKNKASAEPFVSDSRSIFCQKVCLSGDYKTTV